MGRLEVEAGIVEPFGRGKLSVESAQTVRRLLIHYRSGLLRLRRRRRLRRLSFRRGGLLIGRLLLILHLLPRPRSLAKQSRKEAGLFV